MSFRTALRRSALLGLLSLGGCPKQQPTAEPAAAEQPLEFEVTAPNTPSASAEPAAAEANEEPALQDIPAEAKQAVFEVAGHTARLDREQLEALRRQLVARIEESEFAPDVRSKLAEETRSGPIAIYEDSVQIGDFRLYQGDEQLVLDARARTGANVLMGYRANVARKGDTWEVGPLGRYTAHRRR